MDEEALKVWSDSLSEIRDSRFSLIQKHLKNEKRQFNPKEFFQLAVVSLDEIVKRWWTIEKDFVEPSVKGVDRIKVELESVVDLELDSIGRDLDTITESIEWDIKAIEQGLSQLEKFGLDLKKKFGKEIGTLTPKNEKKKPEKNNSSPVLHPKSAVPHSTVHMRGGGSGGGLFMAFIVGLFLGGIPSLYFWDQTRKDTTSSDDRVSQLQAEKRTLQDTVSVLQINYSKIATGKMKTIPELEGALGPLKASFSTKRREIENEYEDKRENLMRRIPPGDRLDASVNKLKEVRDDRLEALKKEETETLTPYMQQLQILKELMGN